jgi:enterochelin esterase family protein
MASGLFISQLNAQFARPVSSPEVAADRSVTFRVKAPNAQKVEVSIEGEQKKRPMTKGADGVWTLTTEPLAPALYGYTFQIDGTGFVDPANGLLKTNLMSPNSMVLVPGEKPSPWEHTAVPHGTLHRHFYESAATNDKRDFFVYTPPNYNPKKKYPMLALLHGFSDGADGWSTVGKANLIFDNLIASGEMRPMIVVMPLGYGMAWADMMKRMREPKTWKANVEGFSKALLEEVIPAVEKGYKIEKNREKRAIAGLSMGGTESLTVGLNHLDKFAWVGAFSSGGIQGKPSETFPQLSEKDNARIRKLWIACGKDDFLIKNNREFVDWLKSQKIEHTWIETEGAHTWLVWRLYLGDFVKELKF